VVVGLGRAEIAAVLALCALILFRAGVPTGRQLARLVIVATGVVVGFPLLSAMALAHLPASHGAVFTGLMPASTATMAVLRAGERPGKRFWLGCAVGVVAITVFAVVQGAGAPQPGDLLMLGAIVLAGLGYAEGAVLAREMTSWRVICWALVLAAPVLAIPVIATLRQPLPGAVTVSAVVGLGYVSAISMFLAFMLWYRGMALAGVARVGQLQLVQPVLTIVWSALLLGEHVGLPTVAAALLVVVSAAFAQRQRSSATSPAMQPAPQPALQNVVSEELAGAD
jgi:drug/metabolite transporter (DMT)-like permease